MNLHTKSRDGVLYDAKAVYDNDIVTVKKGSKINRISASGFKPNKKMSLLRDDDTLFENDCYLNQDVSFNSLSTAATFVTGRIANGMIVWKTDDGKYVKYALEQGSEY